MQLFKNTVISWFLKNKYLFFVFVLGVFLRFYNLGNMPIATHLDEIMNGYVGKFTILNGVDLYGNKWPIFYFNNFGDYPNIMPMYLSGLSAIIFGNTEFAIRFPIALFGGLTILLIYFLTKYLFNDNKIALFSSLTIAIMPWHIVLSRATAEGVTASFIFLLAIYLLIKDQVKKISIATMISLFLLLFTYLLYPSFRIITPLAVVPLFLLTQQRAKKILFIVFALLSLGVTVYISQLPAGKGRFEQTSIISQNSPILPYQSEFISGEGFDNAFKARLLFNKPVMFGREFLKQYTSYFSTSFLFSEGGLPKRYFVPDQGVWYYSYLGIFILFVGLLIIFPDRLSKFYESILVNKQNKANVVYLIYLTLVSLVPAAMTYEDSPNVHRASLFPLFLSIWSGLFFIFLSKIRYRKFSYLAFILFVSIFLEAMFFWNKYLVHANKYQEIYRNGASKNLVEYLNSHKNSYDHIYVSGRNDIPLYYPFFNNIYDRELSNRFELGMRLKEIDNIRLTDDDCFADFFREIESVNTSDLYIMGSNCIIDYEQLIKKSLELTKKDIIYTKQGNEELATFALEAISR